MPEIDKIVIGLTGGIATGKSTVLEGFRKYGAVTISCDKIAREVVKPGLTASKKIFRKFGKGVFFKDGRINRAKLGKIVFKDPGQRRVLEEITHPQVLKIVKKKILAVKKGLIVIDTPLLFEVGWQKYMDATLVVWVPHHVQLKRLIIRNHIKETEAQNLLNLQWPMDKKKELADFWIDNSHSREQTQKRVKELIQQWSSHNLKKV